MTESTRVLASLQLPRGIAVSALDAHAASGVLIAPDVVLLPAVDREVMKHAHTGHLLLVSPSGDTLGHAEIAEITAHGVQGNDDPLVGVVRLREPTGHPAPTAPPQVTEQELLDALNAHDGDLRKAMAQLGVSGQPGLTLNDDTPAANGGQRRPPVIQPAEIIVHSDRASAAISICRFVPWCLPPQDQPVE